MTVGLQSPAFAAYVNATGAVLNQTVGFYSVTPAQFAAMKSLHFRINNNTFDLTPDAQIWPRSKNSEINGTTNGIYLIIVDGVSNLTRH